MSMSGIQAPHLEVTVVDYRISKVELYPWQHLYVVIEYGGRKYKKEGLNGTTKENFVIKLIEGLSEMDIFVLKGSTGIFIGAGKFLVPQGSEESILPVILNTTSGRCIGEVALVVQYLKAISREQPFSSKDLFPPSSSHPTISVSGFQVPLLVVTVVDYRISKVDGLYPWQHFYVVIAYSGRKYKKEGVNQSTTENFVIELIEGLNELDIYVLKGSTEIFIGAGKFLVPRDLGESLLSVILNTTSGRYIGEVDLEVQYSKATSREQPFSSNDVFPPSSSHPSMQVSGIQGPHLVVTVVSCKFLKDDEVCRWKHLYVVLKYGGKKFKKEGTMVNFEIKYVEGQKEMDIFVSKSNAPLIFMGTGNIGLHKALTQGFDKGVWPIKSNTTSGRYSGEVTLVLQYSKAMVYNAPEIINRSSKLEESRGMKESLPLSNAGPKKRNNMEVIKKLNDVKTLKERGFLGELEKNTPKQFSPDELKTFTSGFAVKAGSGGFGTVYKGQFREGENIAVKVLEENGLAEKSFEAEVSTMFKTSHRNLVRFYGYCFDHNMKAIVYEYMENGSLDAVLYGNPRRLEWQKFYKISIEMAKGLAYLHDGCDRQIVHHDLKPANVLLDKALSAKITDFGLARLIDKDVTHVTWTNCGGTIGYMAPEIFMQASKITSKCDVYSFGMMLFEVLRMKRNNEGSVWFPKQVWLKFDNGELDELFDSCGILKEDRARAKILCMVALWCAQFMSDARPSMSKVVMMLEEQIPIEKPPNPRFS